MSDRNGHRRITTKAVQELMSQSSWSFHALIQHLGVAHLPHEVLIRDLYDVVNGGHWLAFGQKHHFMRKAEGQTEFQAYAEAVEWIRAHTWRAIETLASWIERHYPDRGVDAPRSDERGGRIFGGLAPHNARSSIDIHRPSWRAMGDAVHALQDSFSEGHVVRGIVPSPVRPGAIERIKKYSGADKEGHKEYDRAWEGPLAGGFSRDGLLAVAATKELLKGVIEAAASRRGHGPVAADFWDPFRCRWLVASPELR